MAVPAVKLNNSTAYRKYHRKVQSGKFRLAVAVHIQKFNSSNAACYARNGQLVKSGKKSLAVAVHAQKFNRSRVVCYARFGRLVSTNVRHLRSWGNRTTSAWCR